MATSSFTTKVVIENDKAAKSLENVLKEKKTVKRYDSTISVRNASKSDVKALFGNKK